MIFIIGHLLFAIIGLKALVQGKVSLSRSSAITGGVAKFIGLLALCTYPFAWLFGFCFGAYWGTTHPGEAAPAIAGIVVNFVPFVVIGVAIGFIALTAPRTSTPTAGSEENAGE